MLTLLNALAHSFLKLAASSFGDSLMQAGVDYYGALTIVLELYE